MSFNKKAHIQANIQAIQIAFTLDKDQREPTVQEQYLLKQYSGFGGLKCVLNPVNALTDIQYWAKSELDLFPLVAELHNVIRENTADEKEYKRYFNSIKNSVLTAFYTPKEVVGTLTNAFRDSGITPSRILDPSSGMGEFAHAFHQQAAEQKNVILFEKDLLTGKMLSYISPDAKVNIEGFETIERQYNNYFDVVSSNIPFGEMNVFDSSFSRSNDKVKQNATKQIHNYFFLKGVDSLREGGLLAFITSQGVMNSPANGEMRKWLMANTNLVSAIRLPNNLFSDYAGTEVGSDLIVLQKNTAKEKLNFWEELFVGTSLNRETETYNNDYFYNQGRIVQTRSSIGTDPYGKAAMVYVHEGGIEGIASDMQKMLVSDLKSNLNIDLYNQHLVGNTQSINQLQQVEERKSTHELDWEEHSLGFENVLSDDQLREIKQEKPEYQALEVNVSEPVLSLYDLFGFTQEERTQIKPGRVKEKAASVRKGKTVQLSMFSSENKKTATEKPIEQPKPSLDLRPYSGELFEFHRQGSLAEDQGQVGCLKERYKDGAEFQPLDVAFDQRAKISRYIEMRDTYHTLYNHEAKHLSEHASLRSNLNLCYDNFVKRYGNLNDKRNLDVIKMDAGGREILSLERAVDGKLQKADIFSQPVAFNPNELKIVDTSDEALISSLNKYGEVHLDYMDSLLPSKNRDEIIHDLDGRIFYNPLVQNYEIRDLFIAGNVVEKVEAVERYVLNHPDDMRSQVSLKALKEAIPQSIRFEELDFNFGERWIGTDVYENYINKLFETDVDISYYASRDDYTVKADRNNLIINEKNFLINKYITSIP